MGWKSFWVKVAGSQPAVREAFEYGSDEDLKRALDDNGLSQSDRKWMLNQAADYSGDRDRIKKILDQGIINDDSSSDCHNEGWAWRVCGF